MQMAKNTVSVIYPFWSKKTGMDLVGKGADKTYAEQRRARLARLRSRRLEGNAPAPTLQPLDKNKNHSTGLQDDEIKVF